MTNGVSVPSASVPPKEMPTVRSAMINRSGAFRFQARRVGRETTLQQIIALVRKAQGSRPPIARLADVVSGYFTMGVLAIAIVTAIVWFLAAPVESRLSMAALFYLARRESALSIRLITTESDCSAGRSFLAMIRSNCLTRCRIEL